MLLNKRLRSVHLLYYAEPCKISIRSLLTHENGSVGLWSHRPNPMADGFMLVLRIPDGIRQNKYRGPKLTDQEPQSLRLYSCLTLETLSHWSSYSL
jgi:hypothetical protein